MPIDVPPGTWPIHHGDQSHVSFFEGADLLIHDAQYTLEEYDEKIGWGHTPIEKLVDYAIAGRVKQLALFHHDPLRDSDAIDDLVKTANLRAQEGDFIPEVFAAAEGQVIDLPEETTSYPSIEPDSSAIMPSLVENHERTVLIVDDDPSIVRTLSAIMESEKLKVLTVEDGESGARIAVEQEPSLILLDLVLPGIDGLEVCRTLRENPKPRIQNIPIVILTGAKLEEKDLLECYKSRATDYITKPFSPTQLRSKIRS
ncbi:MAG: hypothetical protein CMH76_11275 [Nitrospinae bacterium]|nr:hypothetical protein [Nitrospinota bacterium]